MFTEETKSKTKKGAAANQLQENSEAKQEKTGQTLIAIR